MTTPFKPNTHRLFNLNIIPVFPVSPITISTATATANLPQNPHPSILSKHAGLWTHFTVRNPLGWTTSVS